MKVDGFFVFKKRYNICLQSAFGKDQAILNEIFEKIINRCPNALVGYTNENITKFIKYINLQLRY